MHYVIIGAGAIGAAIGGRLFQHGHQVTLVARGAHLAALREQGLLLGTPGGEDRLRVPAVAGPEELALAADSVLVLAVKSQDTVAALAPWAEAPVRGGGVAAEALPVICAQNGVANERVALRRFARVYGACVRLPATHLAPGQVLAEGYPDTGLLHLGSYPGGKGQAPPDPVLARVAADLAGSGFATELPDEVMRWKYGKLLANLGNGLDALFGDAGSARELREQVRAEGVAVLAAAGVAHTSREEEAAVRGDRVQSRPPPGWHSGGSSTRQSLTRGTGSVEVDYLNGEIVLLGREHGVAAPLNRAVQQTVHRAVRDRMPPGQFPMAEFRGLCGD